MNDTIPPYINAEEARTNSMKYSSIPVRGSKFKNPLGER
ncbi:MAG: hypothetical protein A4E65_02100 [Syntrophorhabdus sp. PtaU1.Bin153]|nr:MAG: hypothetical protein A4E65_02100 [Syntrophorhabdus sp. PtaU1.Bin153]